MKQYQIDRIKDLMDAKGVSSKELASKCGLSEMTIRRVLDPKHNPTTDNIEKIAEALGVHEQYIYETEAESKSKQPINGFIEYGGTISSIRTFKQLEKVYESIKYDMSVPKLAKELRAKDKENKKTQTKSEIDISAIDLRRPEEYDTAKVKTWSFLHTDDERDGISINIGNFSTDHELDLCGEHFYHSESAYIVGLFSENTEESIKIQREVQYTKSPMDAKYTVRAKYTKQGKSRKDWDDFKHQWMLYVVWNKCLSNDDFADLLRQTPKDVFIIENTTNQTNGRKEDDSSDYWGAKNKELENGHDLIEREVELSNPTMAARELKKLKSIERNKLNNVGTWKGINCLGKCLNICKYCLDTGTTPPIDYDLLRSKQIYLFGKLLTFDNEPTPPKPVKVKKKVTKMVKVSESPTATKSQYRTVIFDFDGTLVDTRPLFKYRNLIKGKSRWNDPEGFQKAYKEFSEHLKDCKPFDGIDEVLQFIKENNITAYIVTGGSKGKAEDAIKLFGWEGVFKGAIGRFSVNNTKKITKADNNPILFRKALADIGEDASNCISFGNELVDCHAARKAGIESYCVYWGAEGEDKEIMDGEMKDLTIHNPLEIIDILKSDPKEVILTEDEQLELLGEPIIPNKGIMGALVGDFLGSVYERRPYKDIPLDKELEHKYGMKCTDDTVQTLAVAQWLMTDPKHKHETLIKLMKRYGKKYRKESHGEQFRQWIESKDNKPNDLEEDGSAMRVSPVAYYAKSLEECLELAKISAEVSHNSQEGIYGAQASAAAVYMYLHGSSKDEIKEYISNTFGYDLSRNTNDIRPTYKLETLCSKVVPEAIICFLEGETYEDVIKLAISLGGDADTQGTIAGAIVAAKMPIPQIKADLCYENLPAELKHILLSFYDCMLNKAFPEPTEALEQITSKTDDETQKKLKKLGFKSLAELYKARDEILSSEVSRTRKCEGNWLDAKPISWDDFSFRQTHEYNTQKQECWSFNSGKDIRNGINLQLGNMVNGFGVNVLGIDFLNSEIPYQLAIFKNNEESINVQKEIVDPKNPTFSNGLAMKRVYIYGKDYARYRRDKDFELGDKSWCFEWMKWVVWEKVKQNKGFADLLVAIPQNAIIIEQAQRKSRTLWGAWNDELLKARKIVITAAELEGKTAKAINNMVYKVNNLGVWKGENTMGQILTMCKLALNEGVNLPIDEQLLNDAEICWFGQVLHFTKDAQGNVSVEAR